MANSRTRTGKYIECGVCKNAVYVEPNREGRKKFCSKACLYRSGIQIKLFKTGHSDMVPPGSRGHSEETRIKISLSGRGKHCGSLAWNWVADRSKVKAGERNLNDPLQKEWRRRVKDRDKWSCRIADVNCDGRLEAHHILPWKDFPELRHDVNNGITLCHAHHPRKRADVAKLSPYFQKLVAPSDENR